MLNYIKSTGTVLLVILAAFFWHSCQKDNAPATNSNASPEQQSTAREGLNCTQIKNAVYKSEGMLVFTDEQHFYDCIECLEQELKAYNDTYESQYPTATAEQLDVLDSINNFNEWQPLADFEASKSFISFRSIVEQQSNQWLDSQTGETINFDNDPDELCPIMDEETRALFNSDGNVKIGNEVVSKQKWADEAESIWDCCAFRRSSKYTFRKSDDPYLFEREVRAKIKIISRPYQSTLKGKIKHYRKVGNKYKKRRADMRLLIGGRPHDGNCRTALGTWSNFEGYKKRKVRTLKSHIWGYWREALVCEDDPGYPNSRCGLGFFVDNDSHGYALYLKK